MCFFEYDEEFYEIIWDLIEDGCCYFVLIEFILVLCLVCIFYGMDDFDVFWDYLFKIVEFVISEDLIFIVVKGGDYCFLMLKDIVFLEGMFEGLFVEVGF